MTITATPTTAADYDWADLYTSLQRRGNVPGASSRVIDAAHAELSGMYLDLAEVKTAVTASGFDPPLVSLTADVLNVPAGTTWLLQDAVLFVRARRIQIDGALDVSLDYRTGTTASLTLFCQDLVGRVHAVTVPGSGDPVSFTIDRAPASGGVQVCLREGAPARTDLDWVHGLAVNPTPGFAQALRAQFLFASLLFDQHPDLALNQLAWIKNWSGYHPELLDTFLRSSLLALLTATVRAEADGTVFVPYLTRQVYTDLAAAFVAEAKQYEADYRALSLENTVTADFLQLAKTLLANKTHESEYTTRLLAQAKANYDNAVAAARAAEVTLSDAQRTAQLLAIDFQDVGVPAWEREQIAKAVITLGTAVITFAVGIGAMLVGGEAAGPVAADGAIQAAQAAKAAAETGSAVATLAKKLETVMTDLKKVGEALQQLYELSKVIVEVVGDLQHASDYTDKMRALDLNGQGAELTATYQWQVYQQTSDAALQSPVEANIGYAAELKVAVDAVAVYGQAVAAAHVAAITAGQRYATVSLQRQLAAQEQAELQRYVDSLTAGQAPSQALMQQFYQRYLDSKSSLFSAMQNYRASYFYWALAPSTARPAIIDGVDRLATGLADLTSVTLDTQTVLEQFSPPPQPLSEVRVIIDDPAVLSQLAADGTTRWVIGPDARPFHGLDRVRITRVRIWLEGAAPSDETVEVMARTQGNYLDRLAGKHYQFTSRPLVRGFQYRVTGRRAATAGSAGPDWKFDNGARGYVVQDGSVDSEVSYAYFQPTPFAEWQITVTGVTDLNAVTKITMAFAGSAISQVSR